MVSEGGLRQLGRIHEPVPLLSLPQRPLLRAGESQFGHCRQRGGKPLPTNRRHGSQPSGSAHADSGYVAVNEAGEPYTPDTLTRMWRNLAKSAGVRPIRLHDARHSYGTALHLRGVPLAVIAKWLGRADAETTARIYAHSQNEALIAAGRTLGAVVSPSRH